MVGISDLSEEPHCVIYRFQGLSHTLASTPDRNKLEFSSTGPLGLVNYEYHLGRFQPSVPAPQSNVAVKDDTGFEGLRLMLEATLTTKTTPTSTSNDIDLVLEKLGQFVGGPQHDTNRWDEGIFGLHFPLHDFLSHNPTRNTGYRMNNFKVDGNIQHPSVMNIKIEMEYSGNILAHRGIV